MIKLKKAFTFSRIIIIILILSNLFVLYVLSKTEPSRNITGTYQSTGFPNNLYVYSFDRGREGTYFLKFNDTLLEKGKYERYKENIYICYDESGNENIITLLNESFYFYDHENKKVIEMKKVLEVPLALNIE